MILNQAGNIMFGNQEVQAVYCGSALVWERGGDPRPHSTKMFYTTTDQPDVWKFVDYSGETMIAHNAYRNRNFQKIVLPQCIEELGTASFYNCRQLQSVTFATGLETVGSGAFAECAGLTEIVLPNGVETIHDQAFYQCLNLETISIPNTVKSINAAAFYHCLKLREITIPQSVVAIRTNSAGTGVFDGCVSLTKITVNQPENSISGAPWGAPNATVLWTG